MREQQGAEIVERLAAIGLEDREAKLYVDLLLNGASRASDAAARVKLKRTETYRALESLMKDGFVTARLTRPVEYEASPPEAVFSDLLARHEQQRTDIEALRERVASMAAQVRTTDGEGEGRYGYRIIQGRRAILAATESIIRTAKERISLVSAYFSPAIVTPGNRAYQTLVRRAGEGVPIDLLVREHPNFQRALAPLTGQRNVRTRFVELPQGVRFIVVDEREIVFWLVSDPAVGLEGREDVAMWTNATDFVHAQRALFDALWAEGREDVRLPPQN
jgi:HTH-type transcriptional regulator, sugar sensing transcriptional regulator